MHCSSMWRGSLVALAILTATHSRLPADEGSRKQDEQALRSAAAAYRAALAKGDRKALTELWTADGDFIDGGGASLPASQLLADLAPADDQTAQPASKVTASRIRFLTDEVAIEDGTSEIVSAEGQPATRTIGHYHATWVKQDGRWRLANLCELPDSPAGATDLAQLAWMIGTWTAEQDGVLLEVRSQWNATGTFLLRDLKGIREGATVLRGTQRFGWDPAQGKIKSWSFDSDGGFCEALWTRQGDAWVGQAAGTLADGRTTSATTVLKMDGKDSYTRQTLAGRVQGVSIPDQLVRFHRLPEPQP